MLHTRELRRRGARTDGLNASRVTESDILAALRRDDAAPSLLYGDPVKTNLFVRKPETHCQLILCVALDFRAEARPKTLPQPNPIIIWYHS